MDSTGISWTQSTWNPVTGCSAVSPGCQNCYAQVIAERYRGSVAFPNGFDIQLRPHRLKDPQRWKEPRLVFVNSMSDLFHRDIPDDYLEEIWEVMVGVDRHIYQVLTKRAHRMAQKIRELSLPTPEHIWLGVSVENQTLADSRIPALLSIPAPVRWLSCEPLLGAVDLTSCIGGLQWIVVGGESGPDRRPMDYDWARALRDQCKDAEVAFYYKQGNHHFSGRDNLLDGVHHEYWPALPGRAEAARRYVSEGSTQATLPLG